MKTVQGLELDHYGGWVIRLHSVPRGGRNSVPGDKVLAQNGKKVQGGEPPPGPHVALSPDHRVAHAKNGKFPGKPPVWGFSGEFATIFR